MFLIALVGIIDKDLHWIPFFFSVRTKLASENFFKYERTTLNEYYKAIFFINQSFKK